MAFCFVKQILWFFTFCAIIYFGSSGPADVKEVKLSIFKSRGEIECGARSLDIEVGQQFRVYIDPGEEYLHTVARCFNSLETNATVATDTDLYKDDKRNGYISNFYAAVTTPGRWNFTCTFFTHECDKIYNLSFCSYFKSNVQQYHYYDYGVICFTTIHVHIKDEIYEKPSGILETNGVNFTSDISDDIQYNYKFYEGQGTTFRCNKTNGSKVKIVYTSTVSEVSSTDYRNDSVSMYMKLRAANDKTILQCIISDEQETRQYTINLRLLKNEENHNILNFNVNSLILPQSKGTSDNEYYYEYKYYDGENITVRVAIDHKIYKGVKCDTSGSENLKTIFRNINGAVDFVSFVIARNDNEASISCTVKTNTGELIEADSDETNSIKTVKMYLHFYIQTPDYSPFLSEIPRSNILLQYSNNTSNVVKYAIGDFESFSSVCYSKYDNINVTWINDFNTETYEKKSLMVWKSSQPLYRLITMKCKAKSLAEDKISYLIFTTRPEGVTIPTATFTTQERKAKSIELPKTTTTIKPTMTTSKSGKTTSKSVTTTSKSVRTTSKSVRTTSKSGRTTSKSGAKGTKTEGPKTHPSKTNTPSKEIPAEKIFKEDILTSDPNITVNHGSATETSVVTSSSSTNTAGESEKSKPGGNGPSTRTIYVIAGSVAVVILVAAFILWVTIKKRKNMLQNISSNMDYQNLPEHHEGPMVTPAQWNRPDDATYANQNSFKHLYSNSVPKRQEKTIEPTYAEPRDSMMKHTYINTQQINNEPNYASVQNDETTYASVQNNEASYASVQKNKPHAPAYANQSALDYQNLSTLKKENTYAKVAKKIGKGIKNNNQGESSGVVYTDVCTELNTNNKYVNAHVKNNVEPAYCEIVPKK